jgi:hypothetical protein
MSQDISIFGLVGNVTASNTFPNGFNISAFADDADPLDSPDLDIADMSMGPNGDSITWSRPQLIEIVVNLIPQTQDDQNMTVLMDANRVAKGKSSARDSITIVWTYPNGMTVTASDGKLVTAPAVQSGTAAGRAKTKRYAFRFAQVQRQNATANP